MKFSIGFAIAAALLHIWIWRRSRDLAARSLARQVPPENTPIFLVLLVAIEWSYWQPFWVLPVAIAFLLARLVQAIGTDRRRPAWMRTGGAGASWLFLLLLAAFALKPLI